MSKRTQMTFALCLVAAPAAAQTPAPAPSVIVTHGEATVKRAPDRAWITMSTEVREGKATDARKKSAEIMTAVHDALKGTGLAADAIRTTGYSLTPEMEYYGGARRVKNYVVRNQIEVRVDDLDKLAEVLDAANGPKNAALSIVGPRFDLKNQEAAELDVVRRAVASAMARAEAIATGARRELGPIVRVEEDHVGVQLPSLPSPRPMPFQARDIGVAGGRGGGGADVAPVETPITPGEISIRAQVTLTVAIR